jgi:hypothetical protein
MLRFCSAPAAGRLIAAGLLLAVSSAMALAQFPVPFERNELWGYRAANGKVVIAPRFVLAGKFSRHGIAAVAGKGGWAYIDVTGRTVIKPFVFDNGPDPFKQDLARFRANAKFGFFDRRGGVAIVARFDFARPFAQDRAAVCSGCKAQKQGGHTMMVGGKWGFIDKSGMLAVPFIYQAAEDFTANGARVRSNGKWLLIDRAGRPVRK